MLKKIIALICAVALVGGLGACAPAEKIPKVGASFGVGPAARWAMEKVFMEERAAELGIALEARLNTTDQPTQEQDCRELIDSGIDVLILIPRTASNMGPILDYAKEKGVKVISYSRVILEGEVDLFVGYDCRRIGHTMGQYLSELVYEGDYILLAGDPGDNNATLLYEGAMRFIDPIRGDINVLLDTFVPGWSPEEAKRLVKEAVAANGNHVDAILAPNDKLAGACAEALAELGVTDPVVITGMDAELEAAKRILAGTQSATVYMDLKEMACAAVDQACRMARGEDPETNAEFENGSGGFIPSNLLAGKLVIRENLDQILIDSGYFSSEDIYGS